MFHFRFVENSDICKETAIKGMISGYFTGTVASA
jgi:hypothetical protein